MNKIKKYDIIVIGGGHAGCEAALAAARMDANTLLMTTNISTIAQMSCNPAIGGLAKGHLVREIDALGGQMGLVADETGIQFRMLNKSKGPAVWSPRSQNDRIQYILRMRQVLESEKRLHIRQDTVSEFIIKNHKIAGVKTIIGSKIFCSAAILCTGTFLNGLIHIGLRQFSAGRAGEFASFGISKQLSKLGFEIGRLKTGTPPRIDGRNVDLKKMEIQLGDEEPQPFSFKHNSINTKQKPCFLTKTNQKTHEILRKGLVQSPLYTGRIKGTGPRYCPSVEDKIVRFADKANHQIFLEPEGRNTKEFYLNGFSTSLPEEVQLKALRTIEGLENANPTRWGYAIEYDFVQPTQLRLSLETKEIENLYFAGQINGTSGYEEAASQGLLAGINAVLKLSGKKPFIPKRSEGYVGVLIDDLVTKGTSEPYRMFTSLAEHRLMLRQDNADLRLMDYGFRFGLISSELHQRLTKKRIFIEKEIERLKRLRPEIMFLNSVLEQVGSSTVKNKESIATLLKRPEVNLKHFFGFDNSELLSPTKNSFWNQVREQVEIEIKYEGFLVRQKNEIDKLLRMEKATIPSEINYQEIVSLSTEGKEKLEQIRPQTLAQASRISGVSAADLAIIMVYITRRKRESTTKVSRET